MAALKINVGCGATPTRGWLNVDNSPTVALARLPAPLAKVAARALGGDRGAFVDVARREGIVRADARRLPVADGAAEAVYTSHMVEHLTRGDARRFLAECRRVLRPGGWLRVAVPDLARLAADYVADGDADRFVARLLLGPERICDRRHRWMYDGRSLVALVEAAGFVDAAVVEAGTIRIPDAGDLDLREREEESVYVEGRRP